MAVPRKTKEKDKGGRPTRYRPEYDEQARKLCMLNLTDKRLADFFGISESTLNLWKLRHPSFRSALFDGKLGSDMDVISALKRRAEGYSHPEVDIRVIEGQIVQTELVKHYPPDTPAAMFWLINRHPDLWKSKREAIDDDDTPVAPVRVVVEVQDARKVE